jgi:hypothetical protein
MEASLAPDGRIRLVTPLSNFLLINWALWTTAAALERDERWFSNLSGISLTEAWSLNDEMTTIRYALEGSPRRISSRTGELVPPLQPRRIGTTWDELGQIEAENLPGRRVGLTLPQEKLEAFAGLLEASLVYVAPHRSETEEKDFLMRFQSSTDEVEALKDELRRLGWKAGLERKADGRAYEETKES